MELVYNSSYFGNIQCNEYQYLYRKMHKQEDSCILSIMRKNWLYD